MRSEIEHFPNQETMDEKGSSSDQETMEAIIESSPEIRKLFEALVDPEFELSDRQRIYKLFKGESEEKVTHVLDAIKGGEILDELEGILKLQKPTPKDIAKMRELISPSHEGGLLIEPAVTCKELGPELLRRYFELLQGKTLDMSYYFPSPMRDSHMEDYLRFEMNRDNPEGQAEFVEGFIKYAPAPKFEKKGGNAFDLASNLTISFIRANPIHQAQLMDSIPKPYLDWFYKYVKLKTIDHPKINDVFLYLFGRDRVHHLYTFYKHYEKNKDGRFTNSSLKKLRRMDRKFFDKC